MSYAKQTWSSGDTITAEKLNHIEEGIEAASEGGGGGGGDITVDSALSTTSRNPVQNKIITEALGEKIASPASPATGAFLVWDGTAWVAQTLSTWSGGSY